MKANRRTIIKLLSASGAASLFGLKTFSGQAQCLTTDDILGPFYLPGAPEIAQFAPDGAPGTTTFITGTVYANDCETPVQNAKVDVWHANDGGGYEDEHYRGVVYTGDNGQYAFLGTFFVQERLNGRFHCQPALSHLFGKGESRFNQFVCCVGCPVFGWMQVRFPYCPFWTVW